MTARRSHRRRSGYGVSLAIMAVFVAAAVWLLMTLFPQELNTVWNWLRQLPGSLL